MSEEEVRDAGDPARLAERGDEAGDLFEFDSKRARQSISDPDGAIWPVNCFSNPDELNDLFEAAVRSEIIASRDPRALIHIYPLSISEPEPLLAVRRGGRAWLGQSLKPRERDGESPLDFTLRLLEEATIEANRLLHSNALASRLSAEPDEALEGFLEATRALDEAWRPGLQVDGYPPYMPSFDEFAIDIDSMRWRATGKSSA
jgi:hypothetical protein